MTKIVRFQDRAHKFSITSKNLVQELIVRDHLFLGASTVPNAGRNILEQLVHVYFANYEKFINFVDLPLGVHDLALASIYLIKRLEIWNVVSSVCCRNRNSRTSCA